MPRHHDASTLPEAGSRLLQACRTVAVVALACGPAGADAATSPHSRLLPTAPLPPRRSDTIAPETTPRPTVAAPVAPAPGTSGSTAEAPKAAIAPAAAPEDPSACDRLLASGKVKADRQAAIVGPDGCGVASPIRVATVFTSKGLPIALEPPMMARCTFADGFADWVRDDLAPLLDHRNGGLVRMTGTSGYECRGRNRVIGAKLSEHATGDAVDIRSFVLADHTIADITKTADNKILFAQVKATACARFMTVLGPGSDGYHEDNLHLDFQFRRNGAHFCHWQLP